MDYEAAVKLIEEMEENEEEKVAELKIKDVFSEVKAPRFYTDPEVESILKDMEKVSEKEPMKEEKKEKKISRFIETEKKMKEVFERDIEKAAEELRLVMGRVGKPGTKKEERKPVRKMVLSSLSLQDQIKELEKINLGIDSNIFNDSELAIVKEELYDLSANIKNEKTTKKSEFQADLILIRNKRFTEIIDKLNKRK